MEMWVQLELNVTETPGGALGLGQSERTLETAAGGRDYAQLRGRPPQCGPMLTDKQGAGGTAERGRRAGEAGPRGRALGGGVGGSADFREL